jgi:aspartate dehydrogenase
MRLRRLGIIGSGAISSLLMEALARELAEPLELVAVLGTETGAPRAAAALEPMIGIVATQITAHWHVEELIALEPELVVECAGHAALREHGPKLLEAGIDVIAVSIGALADPATKSGLEAAATYSGARLVLSSGALGGIDVIAAARLAGVHSVVYTSRKPPQAWRDTPAEALIDLANLTEQIVFFEGDAREAATCYPKNANVAAMIALAGPGFEATRVRLIADPHASGNAHEIELRSACADASIRIVGKPMPDNPRTSTTTAYALAREVLNRTNAISI